MDERRRGVIPPRQGRPPEGPSPGQVARRRILALGVLVLLLGGLGWLAVAAIGGSDNSSNTTATTLSSTLVYRTVTRSTANGPVVTVIAMPKPFHVIFPEGFTRKQMAARVGAVARIAAHKSKRRPKLSKPSYAAATATPRVPSCFRAKPRRIEGFLFPATYEFFQQTSSRQLVQDQLDAFCENWKQIDLGFARSKNLTPYDVLIIASMVEKETLSPDERQLVSAVVYNRLRRGMPLQIGATIRCAPNTRSDNRVRTQDPADAVDPPVAARGRLSLQHAHSQRAAADADREPRP